MNLAYLEFIGAITIDRSNKVEIEPPKNNTKYHYIDSLKIDRSIDDLKRALKQAKKEQEDAIKFLYNELVELVKKHDCRLTTEYIKDCLEKQKLPAYIIREGGQFKNATDNFAKGDILFCENEIVLFMKWFNYNFIIELSKKYTDNIKVSKGTLTRDPIEVHLNFKELMKKKEVHYED